MKKQTFADKLAEKSFNSAAIQKSWAVHVQAFGPILEPAFSEDYQARIHLTAALNKISARDVNGGLDKLKLLQSRCVSDADHAAFHFCMGLCFEMAGAQDEMLLSYRKSGEYGHKFYLPYLKVAKLAHKQAAFDAAEKYYRLAIGCFDADTLDAQSRTVLASAYTNLASCLTMMHRYAEAEEALATSEMLLSTQQGRDATKAILYAAMGEREKVDECLQSLERQAPQMLASAREMTDEITSGRHPHFAEIEVNADAMTAFWDWFTQNESVITEKLERKEYDPLFAMLQPQLARVFPFLKRDPEFGIMREESGVQITFADFYMVSLQKGYERLIAACPEALGSRWSFTVEH